MDPFLHLDTVNPTIPDPWFAFTMFETIVVGLKKYNIVAVDIGKYGKTEIKYLVNDKGKINTYSKFICENHSNIKF